MLNWLRKLLEVSIPTFYDREGKEQPLQEGMEKLFAERDRLSKDRFMLIKVIQQLPHESHCAMPPCICAKKILTKPYN